LVSIQRAVELVVEAAGLGREPHLLQRLLQVDDDLAAVAEGQGDHAADPLVVDVRVGGVVDAVAARLDLAQQGFGAVEVFGSVITISDVDVRNSSAACPRRPALAASRPRCCWGHAARSGPLFLPTEPAAAGRATLPQVLNPARLGARAPRPPTAPPAPAGSEARPGAPVPGRHERRSQ
jgi:hypothetical protein